MSLSAPSSGIALSSSNSSSTTSTASTRLNQPFLANPTTSRLFGASRLIQFANSSLHPYSNTLIHAAQQLSSWVAQLRLSSFNALAFRLQQLNIVLRHVQPSVSRSVSSFTVFVPRSVRSSQCPRQPSPHTFAASVYSHPCSLSL